MKRITSGLLMEFSTDARYFIVYYL